MSDYLDGTCDDATKERLKKELQDENSEASKTLREIQEANRQQFSKENLDRYFPESPKTQE